MQPLRPAAMRVLITADSVGGVWRYALDVAGGLNARGAVAAIAGAGPAPSLAQCREAERAGVEVIWLDVALDWMVDGRNGLLAAAVALGNVAQQWRPTIFHLNAPPLAAHLPTSCPVVVAAHSCISSWWRAMRSGPPPSGWGWHRAATIEGFAAADAVVAPSASFGNALSDVYGPLPHLSVVWNGSPGVAPVAKQPYALGAGRWWDESKNLAVLEQAAPDCHWPLRVAGPLAGPNGTAATAENVELLGDLPHDEARRRLAEAAIFVSPSRYEPFGLAVLEAASAGVALILSDIPTFRELWHGCAHFVAPDDAAGFAHAINRLAEDEAMRFRLGGSARRRAARYSIDAQIDGLMGVYSAAARAHRERRRGAA